MIKIKVVKEAPFIKAIANEYSFDDEKGVTRSGTSYKIIVSNSRDTFGSGLVTCRVDEQCFKKYGLASEETQRKLMGKTVQLIGYERTFNNAPAFLCEDIKVVDQ